MSIINSYLFYINFIQKSFNLFTDFAFNFVKLDIKIINFNYLSQDFIVITYIIIAIGSIIIVRTCLINYIAAAANINWELNIIIKQVANIAEVAEVMLYFNQNKNMHQSYLIWAFTSTN